MTPEQFQALKHSIRAQSDFSDAAELKHAAEFLIDIVDNVAYDFKSGAYKGLDERAALKADLLSACDEFALQCKEFKNNIEEMLP